MKQKPPIQKPELCRIDEPFVANSDPVDLAIEVAIPEFQETKEFGKTGSPIVILPDKGLQKGRVIRHVVEDLRCRQTITFKLGNEMLIGHGHLAFLRREHTPMVHGIAKSRPNAKKANVNQCVSSHLT